MNNFEKRQNINFVGQKLDRCQNVQNFEPINFDFIKNFDYLHGLAAKCKKPDDELKNKKNIFIFHYKI